MTNEQEKQWREEFEVWCEPRGYKTTRGSGDAEPYLAVDTEQLWFTWCAAKQSSQSIIDAQAQEIETLKSKLLEESKAVPEWRSLTNYGQVKVGDRIMFELCDTTVRRTIVEILFGGTDKEEMIYDRGRNYYIITSMALKGKGSQKNVRYFPKSAQPKEPKQ